MLDVNGLPQIRLVIAASFTVGMISSPFELLLEKIQFPMKLEIAPYHQLFQQLLNSNSLFAKNIHGINILLVRFTDFQYQKSINKNDFLELANDFVLAINNFIKHHITPLVICFLPDSRAEKWVEKKVLCDLGNMKRLYFIESKDFIKQGFIDIHYDSFANHIAHIPYTQTGFSIFTLVIIKKVFKIFLQIDKNKKMEKLNTSDFKESIKLFERFIYDLNVEIIFKDVNSTTITKVSYLTQLVNQFNLIDLYWGENDIVDFLNNKNRILTIEISDRFGCYGISGIIAFTIMNETLLIKQFLLACRVLGKGIEHKVLSKIAEIAIDNRISVIVVNIKETQKNKSAYSFLESLKYSARNNFEFRFNPIDLLQLKYPSIHDCENITKKSKINGSRNVNNKLLVNAINILNDPDFLTLFVNSQKENHHTSKNLQINGDPCIEKQLMHIWAQIIGINLINPLDNFFMLGGNSLLIVKILSEINTIFAVQLSLGEFYQNPTISSIAKIIKSKKTYLEKDNQINFSYGTLYPLHFSQKGLWYIEQLAPDNYTYNVAVSYFLNGHLDVTALQYAFNQLVQKQDVFRTSFRMQVGELYQVINVGVSINLQVINVAEYSEDEIQKMVINEGRKQFDLTNAPLLRIKLYQLSTEKYILSVTTHHIIYDMWSWKIVNRSIRNFYQDYLLKKETQYTPKPFAYLDYALKNKKLYEDGAWIKQWEFWQKYLKDIPLLDLPTDYANPDQLVHAGKYIPLNITTTITERLKKIAKDSHISLFSLIFSLWSLCIHHYSGRMDFPIGTITVGRDNVDIQDIVGYFVKTVILRINITQTMSIINFAKIMHNNIVAVLTNQDIPYNSIVKNLIKRPTNINSDPIEVMMVFLLHNKNDLLLQLPDMSTEFYRKNDDIARFKLTLEIEEINDELSGGIYFSDQLFNDSTIQHIIKKFYSLIQETTKYIGLVQDICKSEISL